ncbi:MAG: hypothetical protein JWQ49_4243 [Edaphobacter sp.]|nr:hypothetical protein [Edaphobacter sp.]
MSIITLSYVALALFLGYAVAVALSMAATFGITAVSPNFVAANNRIRRSYKYTQDAVWLVCAVAGGYVASLVNGASHQWLVGSGLVMILIAVLWLNVWEMRQRGLGHQLVMSFVSAVGVAVGFAIHLR